jgi:hypothetical protein
MVKRVLRAGGVSVRVRERAPPLPLLAAAAEGWHSTAMLPSARVMLCAREGGSIANHRHTTPTTNVCVPCVCVCVWGGLTWIFVAA